MRKSYHGNCKFMYYNVHFFLFQGSNDIVWHVVPLYLKVLRPNIFRWLPRKYASTCWQIKDLPTFSEKDREFIRNKIDFIGINHYTSRFIAHHQNPGDISFYQVQQVERIGTILQLWSLFCFDKCCKKKKGTVSYPPSPLRQGGGRSIGTLQTTQWVTA